MLEYVGMNAEKFKEICLVDVEKTAKKSDKLEKLMSV